LADDVSACQRGLKLKSLIVRNERDCCVGGEHRADCFTLNGEDVRLDTEWFIAPMRALWV